MKKTLFITMLAAALMGGQVFAADAIPTAVEGYTHTTAAGYCGVYNESGDASGGNVTVSSSATGTDLSKANVYGGNSTTAAVSSNTATMTGGQVFYLYGGNGKTAATGNTVIMTGGSAEAVYGGTGTASTGVASGNVVIVAGDCIVSKNLYGGAAAAGAAANDNKIYLVGKGATATIADAQGKTATYTGGEISLNNIKVGYNVKKNIAGNSIEIYGTGITAATLSGMQMVNFHIADGVLLSQDAMVSLTNEGLNLSGVEIGFYGDAVQDWSAFDGKSITLVNAAKAITIDQGSLGDVEIKGADGAVLATASLALGNEGKSMVLSNIKGATPVPEPTTGTLGLFALAGLCARRRRK